MSYKAQPNHKALGKKLGKKYNKGKHYTGIINTSDFIMTINNLTQEQITSYRTTKTIDILGVTITEGEIIVKEIYDTKNLPDNLILQKSKGFSVILDISQDAKLKAIGTAREFINKIQRLRKNVNLNVEDDIVVFYKAGDNSETLTTVLASQKALIDSTVKKPVLMNVEIPVEIKPIAEKDFEIEGAHFTILIFASTSLFNNESLTKKYGPFAEFVKKAVLFNDKCEQVVVEKTGKITFPPITKIS